VVESDKPVFNVGKEGADLVLSDPTVGREPFVIEQQSRAFVIRVASRGLLEPRRG
jgi:hypothetical protein